MFDQMVMSTRAKKNRRGWVFLPISVALHVLALGGLIFASFLVVDSIPEPPIVVTFMAAPPPPPPPPKRGGEKPKEEVKPVEIKPIIPEEVVQPKEVPKEVPKPIETPDDGESDDEGVEGGVEGGVAGGVVGGVIGGVIGGVLGGVPGGVPGGMLEQPLYAGFGGVSNPELIKSSKLEPEYPELARRAKVEGQVILQAVVHKDGTVGDITVLKSPGSKLGFDEAAIRAVKQWRYKPGLQNGKPVDVYFTIIIDFTLTH